MKTLIIYTSIHHRNTEKIAKKMANILEAKLLTPDEADANTFNEYDLIGFGSGIYHSKFHESLLNFIDKLPTLKNKKAFIFSTSGGMQLPYVNNFNRAIKEKLTEKKFDLIGEFSCRGFNTYGPFRYIGGISKGRPNEKDFKTAEEFAKHLKDII
ncbi:MAG: flavodoxin [Candidatus Altiarchaeales archaeon HGW-Altiarchaeales-2]|nr:MAG: flavodoxin [Candidatus Altiarchaeales archaeon HGW-Altiarchaeales-2]